MCQVDIELASTGGKIIRARMAEKSAVKQSLLKQNKTENKENSNGNINRHINAEGRKSVNGYQPETKNYRQLVTAKGGRISPTQG